MIHLYYVYLNLRHIITSYDKIQEVILSIRYFNSLYFRPYSSVGGEPWKVIITG